MNSTPRANRLHIGLFGRRNVGKSSLINAITDQEVALVSEHPGTTADPVYKAMELLPLGPVVFIDTAGLDDMGALGELRVRKTLEVMDKTDLALMVFEAGAEDLSLENKWCEELASRKIPIIGVYNKVDEAKADSGETAGNFSFPTVRVSALKGSDIGRLKELIHTHAPGDFEPLALVGDILRPQALVVLVTPQDLQAPKHRLILPQVQTLRDILDHGGIAMMAKDGELPALLDSLRKRPDLVITDSQVFHKVKDLVPQEVPLTSFSILMSRFKGELGTLVRGARVIDELVPGDRVLIAEACTHHPMEDDIGRDKLPKLLEGRAGGKLDIEIFAGSDFPEDLGDYRLVLHCGACMLNRKQMMSRLIRAMEQKVPITNYGMAFAQVQGILERVTRMFAV